METLLEYFPEEPLNSLIIDPNLYLSDIAKDFIYKYMYDMPRVNEKQIRNILIVVERFESTNKSWLNQNKIKEFLLNLLNVLFPEAEAQKNVFLTIYSIGDNQKVQYLGKDLENVIPQKHRITIETYVRRFLRKREFDSTFISLYKYQSECMNNQINSCNVGLVDSKLLFVFMILFLMVFLYMIFLSFAESKTKNIQKERLEEMVLKIIALRSGEIKIDQLLQEKCMLCLESLETPEVFENIGLMCSHKFHAICFQTWEQIHAKCPVCRNQIKEKKNQVTFSNSDIFPNDFIFTDALLLIQYDLNRGMFSQKQLRQIYEEQKEVFRQSRQSEQKHEDSLFTDLLSDFK